VGAQSSFLRIHEKTDTAASASERRYEATWFLGYDAVSERYVLHYWTSSEGAFQKLSGMAPAMVTRFDLSLNIPMDPFTLPIVGRRTMIAGNG
jgi:hypothetical protein